MSPDEIKAIVDTIRDADAAEATLDPSSMARVKAGVVARASLGRVMDPDRVYSTEQMPRSIWMLDTVTGLAVEVAPTPFVSATPVAQAVRLGAASRNTATGGR